MAFNLDHTASGNLLLAGSNISFTGSFTFPKPSNLNTPSVFMTEYSASTAGISGFQSCLDLLVNSGELGTVSSLSAGDNANNILLVGNNNLINQSFLPDSVNSSVFVVSNSGQLVLLNNAKQGSVAYTTNNYKTYVLCGCFNNINNWVGLLNPDNCVDSVNSKTGVVLVYGCDLSSAAGLGSNVDCAIKLISTGYTDTSYLTSEYKTETSFDSEVSSYSTITSLTNELSNNPTTGELSSCLSNYTNNAGTGSLFSPYALDATFGTASESQHNVGTGNSCILCVGSLGCIDSSVLPDVSLVEAFIISSQNDLTGLSTATIGDVAFDSVNNFNYILVCSGAGSYSDLQNWEIFAAEQGSLLSVNNHTADPNSTVTIYSDDVCLINDQNSLTVSDKIALIHGFVDGVELDYESSGSFEQKKSEYVLESSFNSIASSKCTTGHVHDINEIENLTSCLSNIDVFFQSNLIDLNKSYSYQLSNSGSANSCGSLILGDQGKSKNNFSLVQAAGKFGEFGDAQYESIVGKVLPSDSDWTNIIDIQMQESSIALLNAYFVSRNDDAFSLQGTVVKEFSNATLPQELSKSIYHTGSPSGDVRVCTNSSGFSLQVKGQTYWTSSLEMVYNKSTGTAPVLIGTYWQGFGNNSWYNINQNWFTENTFTENATLLPLTGSDVQMVGSVVPVVDLDCASWVQPNSIDTTQITTPNGICFVSTTGAIFSGTIYGDAEFIGSVFM